MDKFTKTLISVSLTKSNHALVFAIYQSCSNFRVSFSVRFWFLIGTKTVLEEAIRIQQVILKAMK